jgi:YidC/Oxa1 family membrane protein insertase
MNLFANAFNLILYQPLLNLLILLYQYLPGKDFGIAVIVLTLIIRLILYPLMSQSIKSQKILSELQPKIQEIQQKYKSDKERQVKEIIELYKKEKINPFSGLLPVLIQLPILVALFQVFWKGLRPETIGLLYSFVPHPETINPNFLGLIKNLAEPSLGLAILAGISQFFQSKMTMPKSQRLSSEKTAQFSDLLQKQMIYFFPIFTIFVLWRLPAAIGLYWLVTSLFSIIQQYLIFKKKLTTGTIDYSVVPYKNVES